MTLIHAVMVNLKSVVGLAHRDGDQSSGSVLYGTVALVGPGTGCLSVIRTSGPPCDARPGFRTPVAVLFADKRNPPSSSRPSSIISCPSSVYRPSVISHLSSVSRLPSAVCHLSSICCPRGMRRQAWKDVHQIRPAPSPGCAGSFSMLFFCFLLKESLDFVL